MKRVTGNAFENMAQLPANISYALKKSLMRYSSELARQMRRDAPEAHSLLKQSIKPDRLGKYRWNIGPHVHYAKDVEEGLKPGRVVDKQALTDWVKVKGLNQGRHLKSTVFLIGRKIKREGTEAQPFVEPLANSQLWLRRLIKMIEADLKQVV